MRLSDLFLACQRVPYQSVGISADYAALRDGTELYLFFEHSRGEEDWRQNLNFPARSYAKSDGSVWYAHGGFLSVWKSIEPYLKETVMDPTVRHVVVCGYSHGAAVAVLCHEYVWYHRADLRQQLEGYGFGCPRVYWGVRQADVLRRWEHFTVVRNVDDAVTHLPPRILGYSHVGRMLQIGARGKYSPAEAHTADAILRELLEYEREAGEI